MYNTVRDPNDGFETAFITDADALGIEVNVDDDDDGDTSPRCRWILALTCAALAGLYHADHALGQIIEGEVSDGRVRVRWEYDLQRQTGELTLENVDFDKEYDEDIYFDGIIPGRATQIEYDNRVTVVQRCESQMSAVPYSAFADIYRGNETTIRFKLPAPSWQETLTERALEFGRGLTMSAHGCYMIPAGTFRDFVTVAPVRQPCAADGDFDGDRDVDLRDFAEFQRRYTGPEK